MSIRVPVVVVMLWITWVAGCGRLGFSILPGSETDSGMMTADSSRASDGGRDAERGDSSADADAGRVDPMEVRLSTAGLGAYPTIVTRSGGYAVAWVEELTPGGQSEVRFALLDTELRIISTDAVPSSNVQGWRARMTRAGESFFVMWTDRRSGNPDLYVARFDATGTFAGETVVAGSAARSYGGAIAWTGSELGVVWSDDRDGNLEVYFARVDATGSRVGSDVRVTDDTVASNVDDLVWTGSGFGLSMSDSSSGNNTIYLMRLDAVGVAALPVTRTSLSTEFSWYSFITWTGTEYGVSWTTQTSAGRTDVYFGRVAPDGTRIGGDIPASGTSAQTSNTALMWTGSHYAFAWADSRDGDWETYVALLDETGDAVTASTRVTNAAGGTFSPAITANGRTVVVCYSDDRDTMPSIYCTRLSL